MKSERNFLIKHKYILLLANCKAYRMLDTTTNKTKLARDVIINDEEPLADFEEDRFIKVGKLLNFDVISTSKYGRSQSNYFISRSYCQSVCAALNSSERGNPTIGFDGHSFWDQQICNTVRVKIHHHATQLHQLLSFIQQNSFPSYACACHIYIYCDNGKKKSIAFKSLCGYITLRLPHFTIYLGGVHCTLSLLLPISYTLSKPYNMHIKSSSLLVMYPSYIHYIYTLYLISLYNSAYITKRKLRPRQIKLIPMPLVFIFSVGIGQVCVCHIRVYVCLPTHLHLFFVVGV